jgi:hypothetical protein
VHGSAQLHLQLHAADAAIAVAVKVAERVVRRVLVAVEEQQEVLGQQVVAACRAWADTWFEVAGVA